MFFDRTFFDPLAFDCGPISGGGGGHPRRLSQAQYDQLQADNATALRALQDQEALLLLLED